jgi:hypothetical protein
MFDQLHVHVAPVPGLRWFDGWTGWTMSNVSATTWPLDPPYLLKGIIIKSLRTSHDTLDTVQRVQRVQTPARDHEVTR